mgnify:CR=1 FL=1
MHELNGLKPAEDRTTICSRGGARRLGHFQVFSSVSSKFSGPRATTTAARVERGLVIAPRCVVASATSACGGIAEITRSLLAHTYSCVSAGGDNLFVGLFCFDAYFQ